MSAPFTLEIVTPQRIVFTGDVESVTCPGAEGRFQVLHNHAPFLSALVVGELDVLRAGGEHLRFAIGGGVSQVLQNAMTVLADTAERSDEIDVSRAAAARSRAEQRLAARTSDVDLTRARAALFRAVNRLKTAGGA